MTGFTIAGVSMSMVSCACCSVQFGVTTNFEDRRRDDHEVFYCPSGHQNYYYQKSNAEEFREKLNRVKTARDEAIECCVRLGDEVEHEKARVRGFQSVAVRARRGELPPLPPKHEPGVSDA